MKKNGISLLLLLFYGSFAYFFWIAQSPLLALYTISTCVALSLLIPRLKASLPFSSLLALTHLILFLCYQIPALAWPFDFYLAAAAGFLSYRYIFCKPISIKNLNWSFRFTKAQWLSIAIINIPSISVLYWYFTNNNDVVRQFPFQGFPTWSLPFVVVILALINGLREEIFFRGFLQSLSHEKFPVWLSISLQAIFFGFIHFQDGFPRDWVGVGMTALWGSAIAIQYYYFRSIALAWITHAIADAIIFTIILMHL